MTCHFCKRPAGQPHRLHCIVQLRSGPIVRYLAQLGRAIHEQQHHYL